MGLEIGSAGEVGSEFGLGIVVVAAVVGVVVLVGLRCAL